MSSSIAGASTKVMQGSVSRQSPSLPQSSSQGFEDNVTPSRFVNYVESNLQASVGTSHEALHRYFSSSDYPTIISDHNSVEASVIAHEAKAQAAIDAFDAAIRE